VGERGGREADGTSSKDRRNGKTRRRRMKKEREREREREAACTRPLCFASISDLA